MTISCLTLDDISFDITAQIEPEQMPACPICDTPLFDDREVVLVKGYDMLALAHFDCCAQGPRL